MATNRSLDTIAKEILKRERSTIANVIAIGRLLVEAEGQCEHGEFMDWIRTNFEWSHQTSLRYRRAFELSQNQHRVDFGTLNISQSALYYAADLSLSSRNSEPDELALRAKVQAAIIKTAKKQRVSLAVAKDIFNSIKHPPGPEDHLPPALPDDVQPSPLPELSPEQEHPLADPSDDPLIGTLVPVPQLFHNVLRTMITMHVKAKDEDTLKEIEASGKVEFYRLVDHMIEWRSKLEAISGPVQTKADRAEAKTKSGKS
jgi:hypothetical protein